MLVLLLGNMQSKLSNLLQQTYWKVSLLFKQDRKTYLSLYHHLGIMPNNIHIYRVALCHKSRPIYDSTGRKLNNERLEFLGDAVINMSVADYLFTHCKNAREGLLTTTRTKLVNRQYLNKIAIGLHIDQLIIKEKKVVSTKNNVSGNTLEAILGAVYLDRGYRASSQLAEKWLIKNPEYLDTIINTETNHKARFIEWCQKNGKKRYFKLVSETIENKKYFRFEVEAYVDDVCYGHGAGHSIKEAEQHASKEALKQINA